MFNKLNIGCGDSILEGFVNIDSVEPRIPVPEGAIFHLANLEHFHGKYPENHFIEIKAVHVLEHIKNILPLMETLYHIAAPSATIVICTPYIGSDDAWEDPTHVRAFSEYSFGYFSQPYYWRANYNYKGDWQPEEVQLILDSEKVDPNDPPEVTYKLVKSFRNIVLEMRASLKAIKPARQPIIDLLVPPKISLALPEDIQREQGASNESQD